MAFLCHLPRTEDKDRAVLHSKGAFTPKSFWNGCNGKNNLTLTAKYKNPGPVLMGLYISPGEQGARLLTV